jgi:hypothetical protein
MFASGRCTCLAAVRCSLRRRLPLAKSVTLPRMLIFGLSPAKGDVGCQYVVPSYFADNRVAEGLEPAGASQWVKSGSEHTVADVSRGGFNADR